MPERRLASGDDGGIVFVRRSSDGGPLADVAVGSIRVFARDPSDMDVQWIGHSSENGSFVMAADFEGRRLVARAQGMVSSVADVPARGEESTIWMGPSGDLRVRVVNDTGMPVANARVSVARHGARIVSARIGEVGETQNWLDWPALMLQGTADSEGVVLFRGLPPSTYQVAAAVDGHARVYEPGVSPLVVDVLADQVVDASVVVAPLRAVVVRFSAEVLGTSFSFTTVPAPLAPTAAVCRSWQEQLAGQYPDCVSAVFVHSRMAAGASEEVALRFYARHGGWKMARVRSCALDAIEVVSVEAGDGPDDTGLCRVDVGGLEGLDLAELGLTMSNTDAGFSRRVTFGAQRVPAGNYRVTCANPHTYSILGLPWEFVVEAGRESAPHFRVPEGTFGVRLLVMAEGDVAMDGWLLGVGVEHGDQESAVYDSGSRDGTLVLFRLDGAYRLTLNMDGFGSRSWSMSGQQILDESAGRVLRLMLD